MDNLCEYEKRRLENIKKNQMVLQSLSIPTIPLQSSFKAQRNVKKPASNVEKTKFTLRKPIESQERRISARLISKASGESRKMSVAEELALYRNMQPREQREKMERPKPIMGSLPFQPENRGNNKADLEEAKNKLDNIMKGALRMETTNSRSFVKLRGSRGYKIDGEFFVAKLAQDRIYSLAIHPNSEKIIVSAGSKMGAFAIWDATDTWNGMAKERGETFYFEPHTGSITNQKYNPTNSAQLIMTSYDGTIRCLDINKNEFSELYKTKDKNQLITAFDITKDGFSLLFTDHSGVLTRYDTRQKQSESFQLHEKKAGGFSMSPVDNNILATSSLDDTICIWDARMLKEFESDALTSFEYKNAVTSVYFHPAIRDALVSTCYDNFVRIHEGFLADTTKNQKTNATELQIAHNNQTGRWITPFRAIWDPKCTTERAYSHLVIGNMNRGLDLIEMESGVTTNNLSDFLTAQPAANAIHSSLDLIVSGTASGKCFLWKPMTIS